MPSRVIHLKHNQHGKGGKARYDISSSCGVIVKNDIKNGNRALTDSTSCPFFYCTNFKDIITLTMKDSKGYVMIILTILFGVLAIGIVTYIIIKNPASQNESIK